MENPDLSLEIGNVANYPKNPEWTSYPWVEATWEFAIDGKFSSVADVAQFEKWAQSLQSRLRRMPHY